MHPVWASVRSRLDRFGPDHRSRVKLSDGSAETARVLRSLVGRSGAGVDLGGLEQALVDLGVGSDLDAALTALGHPPSTAAAERRAARDRGAEVRRQLDEAVGDWPEPWAEQWAAEVSSSGGLSRLAPEEVAPLVDDVRRLVDFVDGGAISPPLARDRRGRVSRVDVGARLFGSAHALDAQTLLERLARRALAFRLQLPASGTEESSTDGRDVWEESGLHLDRISSPILTWGLDFAGEGAVARLARASTGAGIPFSLTTMALERAPVSGTRHRGPILVVENPRVVEAAADADAPFAVLTTNGNPRRNTMALVGDLVDAGNEVHYHGDFDSVGLTICARLVQRGCRPYAMAAADYDAACDQAATDGVELPRDEHPAPPTPWSADLERSFNHDRGRRIVHEELVLSTLLAFAP